MPDIWRRYATAHSRPFTIEERNQAIQLGSVGLRDLLRLSDLEQHGSPGSPFLQPFELMVSTVVRLLIVARFICACERTYVLIL